MAATGSLDTLTASDPAKRTPSSPWVTSGGQVCTVFGVAFPAGVVGGGTSSGGTNTPPPWLPTDAAVPAVPARNRAASSPRAIPPPGSSLGGVCAVPAEARDTVAGALAVPAWASRRASAWSSGTIVRNERSSTPHRHIWERA